MPRFKVAHLREQGNDMIIFPLTSSFGNQSSEDQSSTLNELEQRANAAGLRGSAVAVWEGSGGMRFLAPRNWKPFFESISMSFVMRNVNREVSW